RKFRRSVGSCIGDLLTISVAGRPSRGAMKQDQREWIDDPPGGHSSPSRVLVAKSVNRSSFSEISRIAKPPRNKRVSNSSLQSGKLCLTVKAGKVDSIDSPLLKVPIHGGLGEPVNQRGYVPLAYCFVAICLGLAASAHASAEIDAPAQKSP